MKTKNTLSIIISSIALIIVLPGLFLAFTPMRMFGLLFAVLAFILSGIAFLISRKKQLKKAFSLVVLILSFSAILIAGISQIFSKNTVEMEEDRIEELQEKTDEIENNELEDILNELENED